MQEDIKESENILCEPESLTILPGNDLNCDL